MPSVLCSNCNKKYRVDESAVGKKFACKQCGSVVRVPALEVAAAPAAAGKNPAPRQMPAAVVNQQSAPPPPPEPVETDYNTEDAIEDNFSGNPSGELDFNDMASLESTGEVDNSIPIMDETPAPAYRGTRAAIQTQPAQRSWSPPRIGFRLNRGVLIVIAIGVALLVFGGREWMLASNASDTAKDITCEELANNGPGDNLHVRVTNFFSMRNYVWEKTSNQTDWQTVWLPIVPLSAVKGIDLFHHLPAGAKVLAANLVDSGNIHVLIKTHSVKNEGEVESAMKRDSVEGMVINKIESLTEKERDLLHQAYPAFSENNCYILEDGREPRGGLGTLMLLGGALISLFGLFLMFKPST